MQQLLFALLACLMMAVSLEPAMARGGMKQEHPYAAEHIEGLPADVRRAVLAHERACGGKAVAAHYFSVSITTSTQSFLSLHFENFSCPNRGTLCTAAGCLHEIYASGGGGYRRVFGVYAEDVQLTKSGDVVGLEIRRGGIAQLYRWNGSSFAPARP